MARRWDRFWLYARVAGLAVLALFVLQLFLINVSREGSPRMFFWTDWPGTIWVLIVAFALGLWATRLWHASRKTWKDFKVEKAREREEVAQQAVQKTLGDLVRANRGTESQQTSAAPASPQKADSGSASKGKSAADVWTSGEGDEGG